MREISLSKKDSAMNLIIWAGWFGCIGMSSATINIFIATQNDQRKTNKMIYFLSNTFSIPLWFLTTQNENMCLLCSWCSVGTVSRCRAAVRGCAIAVRGVEGSRSSCHCSTCILPGIQSKLYKTMLRIDLLFCFWIP